MRSYVVRSSIEVLVKSEVPFTRVSRSPVDPDKIVTIGGGILTLWSLQALVNEAKPSGTITFSASQSKLVLCQKVCNKIRWVTS